MPYLEEIVVETRRLGLPDTDAEALQDSWLGNGFKLATGNPVRDWRAVVRTWFRYDFFPSQKKQPKTVSITGAEKRRAEAIRRMKEDR